MIGGGMSHRGFMGRKKGTAPPIPYSGDLLYWIRGLASTNFTDLGKTTPVSIDGDFIAVSADVSGAGRDFIGTNLQWSILEPSIDFNNDVGGTSALDLTLGADATDFNTENTFVLVCKLPESIPINNGLRDIVGGFSNNAFGINTSGGNNVFSIFDGLVRRFTNYPIFANSTYIVAVRVTSTNIEYRINNGDWGEAKSSSINGFPGNWSSGNNYNIGSARGGNGYGKFLEDAQYGLLLTQSQTDEVIDYFNSIYSIF